MDGATGEGDGIDSNGYLVINGGTVIAQACSFSMDSGIDSDLGIHINGGTVIATGNMIDQVSGTQTHAVFRLRGSGGAEEVVLKDAAGQTVVQEKTQNDFYCLVISAPSMNEGEYTLWLDGVQQQAASDGDMGGMGFGGFPQMPEGMTPPEGMPQMPEGMAPPEGMPQRPEGMERPGR